MSQLIILSSRKAKRHWHVSYDTILGLEDEFIECINNKNSCIFFGKGIWMLNRITRKFLKKAFPDVSVINKVKKNKNAKVFFSIMGLYELLETKETLREISEQLIIYVFDCWESGFQEYKKIFDEIKPKHIFFAYKKACDYFKKEGYNCYVLPQSMDARFFKDYGKEKSRLFIQMGRRTEILHESVLKYLSYYKLADSEENYVYERQKGKIIFPDTKQLAKEINASWFFVAAPANIMNSKLTGSISEVTARFYEAMACKTLIIGIKPADSFEQLFPIEDAMIEVNSDNIIEVIDELMNNKDKYWKIVEKNYNYVMENHRWKNRYVQVMKAIN